MLHGSFCTMVQRSVHKCLAAVKRSHKSQVHWLQGTSLSCETHSATPNHNNNNNPDGPEITLSNETLSMQMHKHTHRN